MTNNVRVLIVGLGLIGASFGKALKKANAATVLGYDQDETVPQQAVELGVIDEAVVSIDSLSAVDVIVMAVPVLAVGSVVSKLKPLIATAKALTDVGSVKGEVVKAVHEQLGEIPSCFVPGHPIAGAEQSGVAAAKDDLFDRHMHILTPLAESDASAVTLISSLWQACGAEVVTMSVERHDEVLAATSHLPMSVERHDEVLAATSHLPHLLAFSLVDTLARESENREIFKYAAGGFRDFSRIAASDPTMWHDIFLTNKDAMLKILKRFQSDLGILEQAIEHDDGDLLHTVFTRAKSARDFFTDILEERQKPK